MQTIQACVNQRLLSKADRLFTGTTSGRVIELLQNARRAGATEVAITNKDGWVTVEDNGRGIDDFAKLLDLGGAGWDDSCEQSEDPAGVGIFCLTPREVTIRSSGKIATITKEGWTHEPVVVLDDPDPVRGGTILRFQDEPWETFLVDSNAVFSGLQVTVDGIRCPKIPFISGHAVQYTELGCRIAVCRVDQLDKWHRVCKQQQYYSNNVLVNFHGQVVTFNDSPVKDCGLQYLVDLTGAATGVRLMLPARTRLVENEAYEKLLAAIELEAYRHVQRAGNHTLSYKDFLRAKELGIDLPEAEPTFHVGLLTSSVFPRPSEVAMPKDFPLEKCYLLDSNTESAAEDVVNAHLLAALGLLSEPFVPVDIHSRYVGYSWAALPTISKVEVESGKELYSSVVWDGRLTCVDSLRITVHTSDGKIFTSPVCIVKASPAGHTCSEDYGCVLVTPQAEQRLSLDEIWYHLGGWCDEGDTYDTQSRQFESVLDEFWANLVGPEEQLRRSILTPMDFIQPKWKAVYATVDGHVSIKYEDGSTKTIAPPVVQDPQLPQGVDE